MRRSPLVTAIAFASLALSAVALAEPPETPRSERFPNSRKYRDSAPPAVAVTEDLSASIEARALLDAKGTTTIEVTTGSFDVAGSSGGTLERVQIKFPSGKKTSTRIFNGLSGSTFSYRRTDLARGMEISIQAHVRIAGSHRTHVLHANTPVRLRPDVAVIGIDVPKQVAAGAPVSVLATLREKNGDTGARTSCTLLVDGRHVDYAANIWVDAGGTVSCLFSTTFTAGTHLVRVAALSTSPSDWDMSNNEAATEVTAGSASADVWSATASQETKYSYHTTTYSNRPQQPDTNERTEINDKIAFSATINRLLDLKRLDVKAHERTDGQTIHSIDPEFEPYVSSNGCNMYDGRYTIITLCHAGGKTTVNYTRGAGEAMYISKWWNERYDRNTGQTTWEQYVINDRDGYGNPRRYGSTVQLDISVSDGNGKTFLADPYIVMQPYEQPEEVKRSCREVNDGLGTTSCSESRTKITGKRGTDESQ